MNLNNLAAGQVYNNYRQLCSTLGVKPKTGEAKMIQIREFEKYVKYSRSGNKYIIEEILGYPDELLDDAAKSSYTGLIKTLMLIKFIEAEDTSISTTYRQLFSELHMVSEKYGDVYNRGLYKYFYNNVACVSKEVFYYFLRTLRGENKRKIKFAFDRMVDKGLMDYSEQMWVCYNYKDDNAKWIFAEPSDKEMVIYMGILQKLLAEYKCYSLGDVRRKNLSKQFNESLLEEILEKLNWKYTFQRLNIVGVRVKPRKGFTKEELDSVKSDCEERLNKAIKKMIDRIGKNNHNNAVRRLNEYGIGNEQIKEMIDWNTKVPRNLSDLLDRAKESYLLSWEALSDYFIAGDEEAAKKKGEELRGVVEQGGSDDGSDNGGDGIDDPIELEL